MTILRATRSLVPLAFLVLLAACDRQKGPPPPKAPVAATAADTAAPSTVALSGTILEPLPTPATVKRAVPVTRSAAPASSNRVAKRDADPQALRDFRTEQERRDRELLDEDLSQAQLRARDQAGERDRASTALDESEAGPPDRWNDDGQAYEVPRDDSDWSSNDPLPTDDELPMDDAPYDEQPYDDEPEPEDGYDPRYDAYRP